MPKKEKGICLCLAAVLCTAALLTGCSKIEDETSSADRSSAENSSGESSVFDPAAGNNSLTSDYMPAVESDEQAGAAPEGVSLDALSNQKNGWGQGTQVDEKNRPVSCDQYQEKYGKYGAVFIGKAEEKKIYLTFDEGYENGYTAKILDTLQQKKVPAVFFVTHDYVKRNPDLVKRMVAEGHTVGNHTWSHPSMPGVTTEQAKEEIQKLHDEVKEQFQYDMTLFRPPMGEFSERTLAITQSMGYKSVFWSYAYADWDPDNQMDPQKALEKVTKAAHPGAVYLLHAVSATNTEILGDFIDNLREQGYTLAAFDL